MTASSNGSQNAFGFCFGVGLAGFMEYWDGLPGERSLTHNFPPGGCQERVVFFKTNRTLNLGDPPRTAGYTGGLRRVAPTGAEDVSIKTWRLLASHQGAVKRRR